MLLQRGLRVVIPVEKSISGLLGVVNGIYIAWLVLANSPLSVHGCAIETEQEDL